MHEALLVVKTWCNSWPTSTRFHEQCKLPCLMGCSTEKDDLFHYLRCKPLWNIVNALVRSDVPGDVLGRLGLRNATSDTLSCLAAVLHGYHAIKLGKIGFASSLDLVTWHDVLLTSRAFADAFHAAACDAGLACKAVASIMDTYISSNIAGSIVSRSSLMATPRGVARVGPSCDVPSHSIVQPQLEIGRVGPLMVEENNQPSRIS